LAEALKAGQKPSLPDEEVSTTEVAARRRTQFNALRKLCATDDDCEHLVDILSLTRSSTAEVRMMSEEGPWGFFDTVPTCIVEGVYAGTCDDVMCYRLSAKRENQMPEQYRLEQGGWYGEDDRWRVVLSFPELFDESDIQFSTFSARFQEPLMLEQITGVATEFPFAPGTQIRHAAAAAKPSSFFALAAFPDWVCGTETASEVLSAGSRAECVVSAVKGQDLLELLARKASTWPTQDAPSVFWFGMTMMEFSKAADPLRPESDTCISGLLGWEHPPIDSLPYKNSLFGGMELDPTLFRGQLRQFMAFQSGVPAIIP
jgi:hypothetical protein